MGQRPARVAIIFSLLVAAIGCDQSPAPAPSTTQQPTTRPHTVASLVPAATELLIGMNAADRLVAVSNFDPDREGIHGLPRVGDYQTIDWERLASVKPGAMVTQYAPNRLPAGLVQRADQLHIELVNVRIDRLEDIYQAMVMLGRAIGDEARGQAAAEGLRQRLKSIEAKSAGRRVRALIIVDETAGNAVGSNTCLDDVLNLAGGENVIGAGFAAYPAIDRETLVHLNPEVIFQLLPDASPQVRSAAQQVWDSLSQLQAVRGGQVHIITDGFALLPSQHVADLAEVFSKFLHVARSATSTSGPAAGGAR